MLVLSRKLNESIVINDNIVVTVVGIDNKGRARIGVTAAKEIPVHRGEVHAAIMAAKNDKS